MPQPIPNQARQTLSGNEPARLIAVAVPAPLRRTYEYLVLGHPVQRGVRVRIPFGRRNLIGVVLDLPRRSTLTQHQLKYVDQVIDLEPVIPSRLLQLLQWAARYYQHPIGEVLHAALPGPVRGGDSLRPDFGTAYKLTNSGNEIDLSDLKRARLQQKIIEILRQHPDQTLACAQLRALSANWGKAIAALVERGLVEQRQLSPNHVIADRGLKGPRLSEAQVTTCQRISAHLNRYGCFLLHGVTGSGKTEVYMEVVRTALDAGRQALILVPEIGLTPQSIERFQARFGVPVAALHSGLADGERHRAWWMARSGLAPIVLGTRSAVFAPLARPGVIIVDEEHDTSYKQQEGFRYHARDVAIKRASLEGVPIILGSATPSLESLANVEAKRYEFLSLPNRAGTSKLPRIQLIDLGKTNAPDGLTQGLLQAIASRLQQGEQSLIFINRRGFAPVMGCSGCDWCAQCQRCDAKLTFHAGSHSLRCHHCGAEGPVPMRCPLCGQEKLYKSGQGTQRIEAALTHQFPNARVLRIDRDTTIRKDAMKTKLSQIHSGDADILVGTQILSKGHHFPDVTFVGIVNVDHGVYSLDFRAMERLFQLVTQVSGRAGRAGKPGEVLIQTGFPQSPYFEMMRRHDYLEFARHALAERQEAGFPPYSYLALLRAESTHPGRALKFLDIARGIGLGVLQSHKSSKTKLMDPVPSPMERRAGRFRAQLLVRSSDRNDLHEFLCGWIGEIESSRAARQARWSIDVDPMEMY
ncbi:MAG: primosomal protein N' [Gammaproteobacteria bacterium]|nr:primosomal protein N' [Gammaproteobacteria bacterium]